MEGVLDGLTEGSVDKRITGDADGWLDGDLVGKLDGLIVGLDAREGFVDGCDVITDGVLLGIVVGGLDVGLLVGTGSGIPTKRSRGSNKEAVSKL